MSNLYFLLRTGTGSDKGSLIGDRAEWNPCDAWDAPGSGVVQLMNLGFKIVTNSIITGTHEYLL